MKKFILALGLVATLSTTFVSCSADDSAINETSSTDLTTGTDYSTDNGNKDLIKPPMKP